MENYFSRNLKFLREQKNISQNKLGELVGVNQTTIARWENEEMSPSIDNVVELSKILNIPLAELLGIDLKANENKIATETFLLNDILKKEAVLNENEELTEENFITFINFIKANKEFIIKAKKKESSNFSGNQKYKFS